jgi:hypothetical protein
MRNETEAEDVVQSAYVRASATFPISGATDALEALDDRPQQLL